MINFLIDTHFKVNNGLNEYRLIYLNKSNVGSIGGEIRTARRQEGVLVPEAPGGGSDGHGDKAVQNMHEGLELLL